MKLILSFTDNFLLVYIFLKCLAGFESGNLTSLNLHFLFGKRIDALTSGTVAGLEGAEADKLYLVALCDSGGDLFKGSVNNGRCLLFGYSG